MENYPESLCIRCSPADLEVIDRLRGDRNRGALLRDLIQKADAEAARCA